MGIKVGNTVLPYGLMLAPMAGVSDRAYRKICRAHGAEMTFSEMVSCKALCFGDASTFDLAALLPNEHPGAIQIFGHDRESVSDAIKLLFEKLPEESRPDIIDINMGCPVKKIVSGGDGSALMKDLPLAGAIIRAAVKASPVPVTVKCRTGWGEDTKNAPELARIAEYEGAAMITVHGRTRGQMYAPPVDFDTIAKVKQAVSIPVIGNGGIDSVQAGLAMLEATGCDGLMLARGTMGNPFLFSALRAALSGQTYRAPSVKERLSVAMEQARLMVLDKGTHLGVMEARRQVAYYIKGIRGGADLRRRLNMAESFDEIQALIALYDEERDAFPEKGTDAP